ncbi:hypothetical protein AtDm6_1822 [Acetobacter tropicalis]|uniref:Uncharacterized protein n=1 Tax=Acetobacter tropicalis TaxID=104102 RepID=A0A095B1V6_9PROT|nr:hypothetical protein AtDm6_1822 [Acetobacter tropicalis]
MFPGFAHDRLYTGQSDCFLKRYRFSRDRKRPFSDLSRARE